MTDYTHSIQLSVEWYLLTRQTFHSISLDWFYSILFYSILFYSILFYSILFYSPFCSVLFCSVLLCSAPLLFCNVCNLLFHFNLLHFNNRWNDNSNSNNNSNYYKQQQTKEQTNDSIEWRTWNNETISTLNMNPISLSFVLDTNHM